MKKTIFLLLILEALLILPGCKKIIDSLVPDVPDQPTITAVGTPVGNVVSKVIGKSGGAITSADGNAELIFPAGALENDKTISVQAVTQTAPNGVGLGYQFLPEGIKFLQPVTLQFHYTAKDLAATSGDLMGIAFQDNMGGWWRVNDFTNDTVNRIIAAPIKHFTVYAPFDMIVINVPKTSLKVNESEDVRVEMIASDDDKLTKSDDGQDLAPLSPKISSAPIVWAANGVINGNATFGRLAPDAGSNGVVASFKAPARIPSPNPVPVSAQVSANFKYHGKTFNNKAILFSYITITDGQKYLLEIRHTETAPPFIYKDTASLMVTVSNDGKITVSDITNFPPVTNPEVGTAGDCTATWLKDAVGETNIISVTGTISGSEGDPTRLLLLQFRHSGTVVPKFKQVCSGGAEATYGGIAIAGFPVLLSFTLTPDGGSYFSDDGQEFTRLTLQ